VHDSDPPAGLAGRCRKLEAGIMLPVAEIIQKLWTEQRVSFETDYEEEFKAVFSRPGDLFDVVLHQAREAVGFITLKNEKEGRYSIVNDLKINPHPSFDNTPGHGIEVKRKHRKKGIGGALLSLGIGMVQQDYKGKQPSAPFKVVATDITSLGLGCYRAFGFEIREGVKVSEGEYTNVHSVPELAIRSWKMPLLFRFIHKFRTNK
jgi:ribosomal protein S18 acetylase RimI-like enzyme